MVVLVLVVVVVAVVGVVGVVVIVVVVVVVVVVVEEVVVWWSVEVITHQLRNRVEYEPRDVRRRAPNRLVKLPPGHIVLVELDTDLSRVQRIANLDRVDVGHLRFWVRLLLGLAIHDHHHDGVVQLLALAVSVGAERGHDVLVDLVVSFDPLEHETFEVPRLLRRRRIITLADILQPDAVEQIRESEQRQPDRLRRRPLDSIHKYARDSYLP